MRNPTDTPELRREFAEKFLTSPADHDQAVLDGPIELLVTEFDCELATARKRWSSLNADREWMEMDVWLSDRGYVDPAHLEI